MKPNAMTNEFDIQQSYLGREQSPEVEKIMGRAIHDVLKDLLSEGYLYQNRSIDLAPVIAHADHDYSATTLEDEFTHRPWTPYSQNRGFTTVEQSFTDRRPTDALGIPAREMHLMFVIPTIVTWCFKCKATELHDSIPHRALSPYHINPEAIKEPLGYETLLFKKFAEIQDFLHEFTLPRIPNWLTAKWLTIFGDSSCGNIP